MFKLHRKSLIIIMLLIPSLYLNGNNNKELKEIILNAVPKNWSRVPDKIIQKDKSNHYHFKGEFELHRFNFIKTKNYYEEPGIDINFFHVPSKTNSELLNEDYSFSEDLIAKLENAIKRSLANGNDIEITIHSANRDYDPIKNMHSINYTIHYSSKYGYYEQLFIQKEIFTKNTIIQIGANFAKDKNLEKHLSYLNNYVKTIIIPEKYKIYESKFDKKITELKELSPILPYLLGIICIFIIAVYIEHRNPNNKNIASFNRSLLFFFIPFLRIFFRTLNNTPTPTENNSTNTGPLNNDVVKDIEIANNITPLENENLDDSLSSNIKDNILSDELKIDDHLSQSNKLDDQLSHSNELDDQLSQNNEK